MTPALGPNFWTWSKSDDAPATLTFKAPPFADIFDLLERTAATSTEAGGPTDPGYIRAMVPTWEELFGACLHPAPKGPALVHLQKTLTLTEIVKASGALVTGLHAQIAFIPVGQTKAMDKAKEVAGSVPLLSGEGPST